MVDEDSRFLTRVALRNYKSIAACDVRPGPLTFFVGANGSGKSNFLDALRLVGESLRTTLDHALRDRGGINEVRRRSSGHPTHFGIRLEFVLGGARGHYAFDVGARERGGYVVKNEECFILQQDGSRSHYVAEAGRVTGTTLQTVPKAAADRLYLVTVSGLDEFRSLFDALSHMGFYNLNPDRIRDLQAPDPGQVLARDGGNLAAVLAAMAARFLE
jgi:predicted ATPase